MWPTYPCPIKPKTQTFYKNSEPGLTILDDAQPITLEDMNYGPNPVCLEIGEIIFFRFLVVFNIQPPESFDVTIEITDRNKILVKTLFQNYPTKGQSSVPVIIRWDGKDEQGNLIIPGGYGPHFKIETVSSKLANALEISYEGDYCGGLQIDREDPPCKPQTPCPCPLCPIKCPTHK